jgi:hypothetical protein
MYRIHLGMGLRWGRIYEVKFNSCYRRVMFHTKLTPKCRSLHNNKTDLEEIWCEGLHGV